jgi:hypothetical protein
MFDEAGQLCVVSAVCQYRISQRDLGEHYCAMLAEARRSILRVILSPALPVGPLLGKHVDDLKGNESWLEY